MTSEMQQAMNDPNFVVQFAIGDPAPELIPQDPNKSKIEISGVYFNEPKRYIIKKAHVSYDDNRIFDYDTGTVVMVSHHPGKNPYDSFDPLGVTDNGQFEMESLLTITGYNGLLPSDNNNINIRAKTISRHGRQYISYNDEYIMNVGKLSKLKTRSLRPHYGISRGKKKDDMLYKLVADMMGRTISILNEREELVAQIKKSTKALIQMATFGSGTESTIDIAPGVDCSVILAIVFGIGQIGKHLIKDTANEVILEPLQDAAVDEVINSVTGDNDGDNDEFLLEIGQFIFDIFSSGD